jgi:hypothetical protein
VAVHDLATGIDVEITGALNAMRMPISRQQARP